MEKKKLKLTDMVSSYGENTLHCPVCDGFHLHQGRVEIFNRGEDEATGNHVSINGDDVRTDRNLSGNPSGRRHGLTIHFSCEECPADVRMHVYQHKGNTFMGMEYQDKKS